VVNILLIDSMGVVSAAAEGSSSNTFGSVLLPIVAVVGFLAAAGLGSVAWYNSKRPMGWQNKKRPGFVPKVEESETPGLGNPNP
jgi:hypothetical protein